MKGYPKATIQIVHYYSNKTEQKQNYVCGRESEKLFTKTIRNYNNIEVRFDTKENFTQLQQKQQQKSNSNISIQRAVKYTDIFGTGFPEIFRNNLNRRQVHTNDY